MSDERGTPVANRTTSGELEYTGLLRAGASEARLLGRWACARGRDGVDGAAAPISAGDGALERIVTSVARQPG